MPSDAVAATYAYDTWGNLSATPIGVGATNPFRYAGGAADSNGLTKFGTRYYDPTTGRFTQTDPSGQESNRYAYVGCNPVNAVDPSGLSSAGCAKALTELVIASIGTAGSLAVLIAGIPTVVLGLVGVVTFIASITGIFYSVSDVIKECS